jgi:apolipoprotein N-acyltransferase
MRGIPLWLAFAFAWVWVELGVSYTLNGFPWLLLGVTWRPWITMIQIADLTSVYGVSFLVALLNGVIADCLLSLIHRRSSRRVVTLSAAAVGVLAVVWLYGGWRLDGLTREEPRTTLRIAGVQECTPLGQKRNPQAAAAVLERYAELCAPVAQSNVDLIVWSESAIPPYLHVYGDTFHTVTDIVNRAGAPLLSGLLRFDLTDEGTFDYFNSMTIVYPDGGTPDIYDKVHLVPFGEYSPLEACPNFLQRVGLFVEKFLVAGTDLQPITLRRPFAGDVSIGPLVCFEDCFGPLARAMVRNGAEMLVAGANDGWTPGTFCPHQHAAAAAFRAVETRRPLVRVCNYGVSSVTDRNGRALQTFSRNGRELFVRGVMYADVPIHASRDTLYLRYGNWFLWGWGSAAVLVFLVALARPVRRV